MPPKRRAAHAPLTSSTSASKRTRGQLVSAPGGFSGAQRANRVMYSMAEAAAPHNATCCATQTVLRAAPHYRMCTGMAASTLR